MKKFLFATAMFAAAAILSVNSAIAMQWRGDLSSLAMAPGALMPTLASPCALAQLPQTDLGGAEVEPLDQTLAEFVHMWLGSMTAEEADAILEEGGYSDAVPFSGKQLVEMELGEVEGVIAELDDGTLGELEEVAVAKAKAKPCKTSNVLPPVFGCKSGVVCASATCKDDKGKVGKCKTSATVQTNPLWIGCPGFKWYTYSCQDSCPAPAASVAMGLIASLGAVFGMRRKQLPLA